jgi:hypothetical protein
VRDERALEDYRIDNTATLQMWWCKCMLCRALLADQTSNTMRVYVTSLRVGASSSTTRSLSMAKPYRLQHRWLQGAEFLVD